MVEGTKGSNSQRVYVITGPTSGIGLHTALELARHGRVVLVGREPLKLREVKQAIERRGGRALSVARLHPRARSGIPGPCRRRNPRAAGHRPRLTAHAHPDVRAGRRCAVPCPLLFREDLSARR
jgi:NAD(P)-dependent dehydrogenase (short-subunit alcohol dehydrogenase family)